MIDLVTASQIASIAGNAVGIIDKVYSQFIGVATKKPPEQVVGPSAVIANDAKRKAIVSSDTTGQFAQIITYDELSQKLLPSDLSYIRTLGDALENLQGQWESAYADWSVAEGAHRGLLEGQLKAVGRRMSQPLGAILEFVQKRLGMALDDHYLAAREIAARYSSVGA